MMDNRLRKKKYEPLYWADGAIMKDNKEHALNLYYIDMQVAAHKSLIRELMDNVQDLRAAIKRIEDKQDGEANDMRER